MKKILVVRNDKIGDFMLAWPSFAMLKKSLPDCHITALVPNYTVELAWLCPWIDDVMVDPTKKSGKSEQNKLIKKIKQRHFDASINLFSTTYNALLVWKSCIPYRLAPATKIAQIFYNRRIKQRRSLSVKPEYQYNLDLIRSFLSDLKKPVVEPQAPYFNFPQEQLSEQKKKLSKQLNIRSEKPWVYVHAGSGGSANNLSLDQYAELVTGIEADFELILTAGPGEEEGTRQLHTLIAEKGKNSVIYDRNDGLIDFSRSIACANMFIAGSTGPLHIAATLDVPTVGFFPRKRSSSPLRWLPINSEGRHLSFCPPEGMDKKNDANMSLVDLNKAIEEINFWAVQYLS